MDYHTSFQHLKDLTEQYSTGTSWALGNMSDLANKNATLNKDVCHPLGDNQYCMSTRRVDGGVTYHVPGCDDVHDPYDFKDAY